jgi:hypothetical protein
MRYTEKQRAQVSNEARGRIVESLEWTDADGGYWTMTFSDGATISFRLMNEMVDWPRGRGTPSKPLDHASLDACRTRSLTCSG